MKIGIFDPYLDDLGGGEKYMMTIAECLSKRHKVVVFWNDRKDLDEILRRFSLDLSRVVVTKNIFSPKVSFVERLLKTKLYDVIIVLSDGSIPFSLSKKLFIHIQSPMIHVKINGLKTKFKISRVTNFFCNAYFTKQYIDRTFGVESAVLYPPVNILAKKIKKENIILHVGRFRARNVDVNRLVDYKKQEVMIRVFKDLVKSGLKEWRFILAVGLKEDDRVNFGQLQKEAFGYPIEFMINKTNKELWDLYSRAKIYWHASGYGEDLKRHPERAEHFGISTVEAMAAGTVPVVFAAGGQREIVEDGKDGFFWKTLSQLQEKTLLLINNEDKRQIMAQEAQKRAQDFSKEKFCQNLYEIIEG